MMTHKNKTKITVSMLVLGATLNKVIREVVISCIIVKSPILPPLQGDSLSGPCHDLYSFPTPDRRLVM